MDVGDGLQLLQFKDDEEFMVKGIYYVVIVYAKRAPRGAIGWNLHTRSVRRYPKPNNILILSVER